MSTRTIVIADCHGQPYLIENALKDCQYDESSDSLIFAGDLVDIGDDAHKCLEILLKNKAKMILGNHDVAVLTGQRIHPQNMIDDDLKLKLYNMYKNEKSFKFATHVDDILITHAGISESFYSKIGDVSGIEELCKSINELPIEVLWEYDGPLWYRPNNINKPIACRQIVGHTPPEWISHNYNEISFDNLFVVDPYTNVGFGKNRFRYAVVDGQDIVIVDSNHRRS